MIDRAQTIKAGTGVLTVKATGFDSSSSDSTAVVKICYEASQLVGRKWRKKNDIVDKNKQCKQTAVESDQLAKGVAVSDLTRSAGFDISMPLNVAPNNYYIQVLEKSATNGYLRYGNSACTFAVNTYERTYAARPRRYDEFLHCFLHHRLHCGHLVGLQEAKRGRCCVRVSSISLAICCNETLLDPTIHPSFLDESRASET